MRLIPSLYVASGTLLAIALGSVAMTLWSGRQAALDLERTDLANRQYQRYLELSSTGYRLLQELQAAGAGLAPERQTELEAEIRDDVAAIRDLTAREIQLVGEEEIEELGRLSDIQRAIDGLVARHVGGLPIGDDVAGAAFTELIREGLADEAGEVAEARSAAAARMRRSAAVALGFALVAVVATGTGVLLLVRAIRRPVDKLLAGVRAFRDGELGYRIPVSGRNELDAVGGAFNQMAHDLALREQALSQANQKLETAVTARTAELQRALGELTASEASRRRMLADVSHELRTPLTIIRGEADVALRGGDQAPAVYQAALEKTRDAATHTARLVDDLLFVARHESDSTRLDLTDVDLAGLLPEVIDECRHLVAGAGQQIRLESAEAQAPVRADRDRIRQVVTILLENAMRYGGVDIAVALHPTPVGYAVSVTDDGPGMGEAEMAQAFDRFFRGSNAGARYASGSGLGLPVAKSIVEAHGGTIALTSCEAGRGITATFTVPRRQPLKAVS